MSFWAESGGEPPRGVLPSKGYGPTPTMVEDESARDRYAQAFGDAFVLSPSATTSFVGPTTIDRSDYEARRYQDAHAARLEALASGAGGGVAMPTAYANLAAAGKINNAYAASKPPTNAAASMRLAQNTNTAQQAGAANRIAALGAQEQLAAYNALSPTLAGMRAQDFGVTSEQAKLNAQTNLANAGYAQNTALHNQEAVHKQNALRRAALGGLTDQSRAGFNDAMSRRRYLAGDTAWRSQFEMERQAREDAANAAYFDTAAKGFGYLASAYGSEDEDKKASDARVKTDVKPLSSKRLAELYVGLAALTNGGQ